MNNPHVVSLTYRAEPIEGFSYADPAPVTMQAPEFEGTLHDGRLVARMRQHYPTDDEARVPVDAYLRAWEIAAGLRRGRLEFRFQFDHAEIVDLLPIRSNDTRAHIRTVHSDLRVSYQIDGHITSPAYPPPPVQFVAVPIVETLWRRYERYVQGKEPLFAMAYFCLTAIERDAGTRKQAAQKFSIDFGVLRTLGELSSERGDAMEARKAGLAPATTTELAWLRQAMLALIKQVGTVHAGAQPVLLTMRDLPPL